MRLKTLELQGFKSFPDKTVISFDKGITVIVGPNGSGKSNISDAMRWVLGEMSTKSMRGQKMEDVIFSGSQKRSPMGYAEVTVTFDNSGDDGERLESMADYDEVSVSRRYYRVGEGEYFINKKQVKLRDVHELFMNTGLGKGGYSIIGQGKIAEIISQKNEERRSVFEEAAGISKYRYQKADAVRKLEQTNTNLSGAEIILSELEGRVGPLEKEAEKAKKYLEIYESKKAIDIALSLFDINAAKDKAEELAASLASSKRTLDSLDETISSLDATYSSTYDALMQSKADSEQNVIDAAEAARKADAAEAEIRVAKTSNEHFSQMKSSSAEKLEAESKLFYAAKKEYENVLRELSEAEKKKDAISKKIAECEESISDVLREAAKGAEQIADTKDMLEAAKAEEVEARVSASVALAQKESGEVKGAEIDGEIEKHKSDVSLFEDRVKTAEEKIAEYDEKADDIKKKLDGIDERKADIEERRRALGEEKNTLFLDVSRRRHRVLDLSRMEELLDGYSSAVRFTVNEHKAGKITLNDGKPVNIYGPVSKLVETEPKYSTAIETAFGASLQNIVCGDENDAKAIISHLKKKNAGRATLYPVSTMNGKELDARAEGMLGKDGFVAVASELVKADKMFDGIIRSLIGRVVVCKNMDSAASIAKATGYKYKCVTLDGQTVNAGGSFTGGSVSTDGGMLSRRAQIEKLNAEIAETEKKLAETDKKAAALMEEEDALKKEESVVLGSAAVLKTLRDAEATQLEVIKSNIDVIKESMQKLENEREAIMARAKKDGESADDMEKKSEACRQRQQSLIFRISELENERDETDEKLSEMKNARAELDVEFAKEEKTCELIGESAASSKERLDAHTRALEDEKLSREALDEKIRENEEKIARFADEKRQAEKERALLEAKKGDISAESDRLEKKLTETRQKQSDASHSRELAFEEYTRLDSTHAQMREKEETLVAFLWDTYELTYSAASALGYEKITPEARHEAVQKQTKYKNIMRSLGSVNVNSIDEYAEVKGRYEYYTAQIDDLHKSRDDLEKIISSLEEKMTEDFTRTVAAINENFGKVFAELFGGGHAEVKISDMSNILESGIEINVAPPGKIIKSLSLLSGGEQAFVAIALYFAILEVNPSPFCIMDEIESALDEVNVDKFADYVKNYSDKTQFVLITHRRGTMEAAERLYGVTMHEKGISDVLSIDVSEIESRIGAEIK